MGAAALGRWAAKNCVASAAGKAAPFALGFIDGEAVVWRGQCMEAGFEAAGRCAFERARI